jgi:hypothetical protein
VTNIGGTTFARAQRLQYPADAVNVRYGAGCNDVGLTISAAAPLAGSEFFQINLRGGSPLFPALPNGTPCVLLLSLGPDATPIRSCTQLVSLAPGAHIGNFGATMLFGHATVRYPLTDDPLFQRDLYGQWVWRPGAGAMGMSSGLRMQVR